MRNILIKVGRGTPEFTPVEIATTADPSVMSGTTSSRSMNQESLGECQGRVIRSFMRSPLRLTVLRYLFDIYPQSNYLSEIARSVNSDPSNITGALRGSGIRYTTEDSLISMNLVEVRIMKHNNYYRINENSLEKINEILRVWNNKKNVALELV